MTSTPRIRRVRGGSAAALVSTFVALLSHLFAGGDLPGPAGVLIPLALSTLLCIVFAGVRSSPIRLGLSVSVSQFFFHSLFVLGAGGSASTTVGGSHAEHLGSLTLTGADSAALHAGHADTGMWLAHAGAAVLTAVILFRAETVLATLRRLWHISTRLLFLRVCAPTVAQTTVRISPPGPRACRPRLRRFRVVVPHRGPPSCLTPVSPLIRGPLHGM